MSSLWYLTGDPAYYNLLARARSVTAEPPANTLFPPSGLWDGDPEFPCIFGALSPVNGWVIDTCLTRNDTLDAWSGGAPVDWQRVVFFPNLAFVSQTSVAGEVRSGSAAKIGATGGPGEGKIVQEFTVRSGEPLMLDGWMRGDGVRSGQVSLLNLHTNRYLRQTDSSDAESSWGEYQSLFTQTAADYSNKRRRFNVEPYSKTLRDTCKLQLTLKYNHQEAGGPGTAYFDDWILIPGGNGVTVHGHNAEPSLDFHIYASSDVAGGALVGIDTVRAPNAIPSFYKILSSTIYRRTWRLRWELAWNLEERVAGEVVLGNFNEATFDPEFQYTVRTLHPQIRNATRGRVVRSTKDARFVERAVNLPFSLQTAQFEELRQEWYERSWGGHYPMVAIFPPLMDTDSFAVQGRLSESLEVRRNFLNLWKPGDVTIAESPLPKVTK